MRTTNTTACPLMDTCWQIFILVLGSCRTHPQLCLGSVGLMLLQQRLMKAQLPDHSQVRITFGKSTYIAVCCNILLIA